jgi:lipopolysaccharide transport system ATP-binding protein
LVSHNAEAVISICDRALLISAGNLLLDGTPRSILKKYHKLIYTKSLITDNDPNKLEVKCYDPISLHLNDDIQALGYENKGGLVKQFYLLNLNEEKVSTVASGFNGLVRIVVEFQEPFSNVLFGFNLKSVLGLEVAGLTYPSNNDQLVNVNPGDVVEITWQIKLPITSGTYFFTFGVRSALGGAFIHRMVDALAVNVIDKDVPSVYGLLDVSNGETLIARSSKND